MSGLQIKKRGELEAIRGMATLSVVFGHFFSSFSRPDNYTGIVHLIYSSLTNGTAAVVVFFVLSGLVLPLSFFRSDGSVKTIQISILNRFPRLFFLVFITVMGSYIAYALGLNYSKEAAELSGSNWLASEGYPNADGYFTPDFVTALWQSTIGTLLDNRSNFNVSLWTMAHELFGSFVTFGLAMVIYKAPMRVILAVSVVALIVLQFTAWRLTPFVVGTVISIYLFNKPDFSLKLPVSLVLIAVGLLLYRFHISRAPNLPWHLFPGDGDDRKEWILYTIAGFCIIIGVVGSEFLRNIMNNKWLVSLGRHSFAMYASHMLIVSTVISYMYVNLYYLGQGAVLVICTLTFICILLVVSRILTIADEVWTRKSRSIITDNVFK